MTLELAKGPDELVASEKRFIWLVKSANFVAEYISEFLVVAAAAFGGFASVPALTEWVADESWVHNIVPGVSSGQVQVTAYAIAVLITAVNIWVTADRKKSRVQLERSIQTLTKSRLEDINILGNVLQTAMSEFAGETELWGAEVRASLYRHSDKRSEFVRLARVSSNPSLKTAGRNAYPDNQGFIAQVWTKGEATVRDLPEDRTEWNNILIRQHNFSDTEAAALTMQARSMCGIRLEYAGEPVGLIIVEGLNPRGVTARHLDAMKNCGWAEKISMLFAVSRENIGNLTV
ncbi:hypothetical protein GCM10009715_35080 [Paeniglutamicibacter psychrophenolicus]|uniref:GAF domain-containing protein n=1 Tax=Paeniglutamicibacter psychrophenolicus TaxID=257454 RepID=A0ABS4WA76_9MICC|nr:hypothetical protein [Paeniglutamicibacter psychrophenolicus]MBP2373096.1 hypothetical protein [Paeniglutamicibacter psychrophenolicus]